MREIDVIDLVAGLDQHRTLLQGDARKVRYQASEIATRKRRQKLVVQGEPDF